MWKVVYNRCKTYFIIFFSVALAEQQCGENEEYTTCGSACPPVCGDKTLRACADLCVQGCFCKPNFIKTKNGQCIASDDCKE